MIIENKKAQHLLTEETLKIVIAVICLVFLAYLAYSIYRTSQTDMENAKASLGHIQNAITNQALQVEIFNPTNWALTSWSSQNYLPKYCSSKGWEKCLCVCISPTGSVKNYPTSCETKSTCIESNFTVKNEVIPIQNPPVILKIDYQNKTIIGA